LSAIFNTPFEKIKTNLRQRKPKINDAVFVSTGGCVETINKYLGRYGTKDGKGYELEEAG